jgi:outer membrane protein
MEKIKKADFPTGSGAARIKKIALSAVFAMFTILPRAQQAKMLSLDEAVELAINHDLRLKADTAQISILNERLILSKKANLPDIDVNINYTRISDNITPFRVKFPTGDVTLNPQIINQSYNSLQLRQLIWSGGKVKYGIGISKMELKSANFDLEKNKLNTAYNASALWYNLYVSKTSRQIVEANIKTLLSSQVDVKNFVLQGLVLENDALKIDLAITNLRSNLIEISNAITAINFDLCILTGLPTNTIIELPEINQADAPNELSIESYMSSALAKRAELKSMEAGKDIAALGLRISKNNYLPTVSGIASGNYNLPEQRVFPNENKFKPTWFVGVNVVWSVSQLYKNPSRINESRSIITRTNYMYDQIRENIMIEVNAAYTDYLQANEKVTISRKALEQATENFRVEQNRLNASTITTTDFLEANAQLLQARLNLNASVANSQLALKKLKKTAVK